MCDVCSLASQWFRRCRKPSYEIRVSFPSTMDENVLHYQHIGYQQSSVKILVLSSDLFQHCKRSVWMEDPLKLSMGGTMVLCNADARGGNGDFLIALGQSLKDVNENEITTNGL
jgi:hypothetical protein